MPAAQDRHRLTSQSLRAHVQDFGANGGQLVATALGDSAAIDDEMVAALELSAPVATLTPKTVQGYFTGLLAQRLGRQVRVDSAASCRVQLTVDS